MEWNEETTEEQGGAESPAVATDDISAQSSEKKEDSAAIAPEENEWDRLLRVRSGFSSFVQVIIVSLQFYISVSTVV